MKRALVVVGCLAALLPAAATGSLARAPKALTPRVATTAFGKLLHQLYGKVDGYWKCPAAAAFAGNVDCLGEFEAEGKWHQFSARAHRYHGIVDFHLPHAWTWAREWSPYSRHYILRSGERQDPGVVSVNSPAYDWGWLANCAGGTKAGHSLACDAADGYGAGMARFYVFTCRRSGALITCTNALGDAMRYRPRG